MKLAFTTDMAADLRYIKIISFTDKEILLLIDQTVRAYTAMTFLILRKVSSVSKQSHAKEKCFA